MDDRSGWTLEQEAAAGAIGGHAGTHMPQGLAPGDTLGGTRDLAQHPDLGVDDAGRPETPGPADEASEQVGIA
jgi:hypothetical protein